MIIQLDEQLINQIAAGEVIERPSSVVKELLENALDANATEIEITIEEGGLKRIEVQDNGQGMNKEDLEICLDRHSTSKIKKVDDLFGIATLGFRGEALASIASVSHMKVQSKQGSLGFEIDGQTRIVQPCSCKKGTNIVVKELFHSTPVRKKYMRTTATEIRRITELLQAYALAYPRVGFSLKHNGMELVNVISSSPYNRIVDILGATIGKQMIPIEAKNSMPGFSVEGYISKPQLFRKDRRLQYIFVNKRLISNQTIGAAINRAYQGVIHQGLYPVALLHLTVDPHKIDVNVHPTKAEIRFEEDQTIFRVVYHAIDDSLKANNLTPELSLNAQNQQQGLHNLPFNQTPQNTDLKKYGTPTHTQYLLETPSSYTGSSTHMDRVRIIGLVHKKYIIGEDSQGMLMVDFHAAHERINYEMLLRSSRAKEVKTQQLVKPTILDIDVALLGAVEEYQDIIGEVGFLIEPFGEQSILVRQVPVLMGRQMSSESVIEVLQCILDNKKSAIETIKEKIIASMACRMSYMAGDELMLPQMKKIIDDLFELDIAFSCPHGRPAMIRVTIAELDKMFQRTL